MFFLIGCSNSETNKNIVESRHDQVSSNVVITLTKKGNITAKIQSDILKKNNELLQWMKKIIELRLLAVYV